MTWDAPLQTLLHSVLTAASARRTKRKQRPPWPSEWPPCTTLTVLRNSCPHPGLCPLAPHTLCHPRKRVLTSWQVSSELAFGSPRDWCRVCPFCPSCGLGGRSECPPAFAQTSSLSEMNKTRCPSSQCSSVSWGDRRSYVEIRINGEMGKLHFLSPLDIGAQVTVVNTTLAPRQEETALWFWVANTKTLPQTGVWAGTFGALQTSIFIAPTSELVWIWSLVLIDCLCAPLLAFAPVLQWKLLQLNPHSCRMWRTLNLPDSWAAAGGLAIYQATSSLGLVYKTCKYLAL